MPGKRGVSAKAFPEGAAWVDRLGSGILPVEGYGRGSMMYREEDSLNLVLIVPYCENLGMLINCLSLNLLICEIRIMMPILHNCG